MATLKPHFSSAKRAGDFIFISGQLPFSSPGVIVDGNFETQVKQCIDNIEEALRPVHAELSDIVKTMVWLVDPSDFAQFNEVYARYFPQSPPARATVCSVLMVPDARIEIEALAYKPIG